MTMAKTNIESIAEILSVRHNLTKKESTEIIVLIFDIIAKSLEEGEPADIRKFGRFYVKDRPARMGVNPKTMERIEIPERKTLAFQPSSTLKNRIK